MGFVYLFILVVSGLSCSTCNLCCIIWDLPVELCQEEEKGTTEDEMVGWHHRLNGHEFKQAPGALTGREAWRAAVHGVTKSRTGLSDWTKLRGLRSCGVSFLVVLRWLSCSTACGVLVPQTEMRPASPTLPGEPVTPGPPGKSLGVFLM